MSGGTMKLHFENLAMNYGKVQALIDVNLTLTEGIYGLLGPNGAGKSTLMNILTGNIRATSGRILLDNCDITTMGRDFRSKIGYMPQQQFFYPSFTAERFLYYFASLRGMNKKTASERIIYLMDSLDLTDIRHRQIKNLSGGMKQRLLFAQAVLANPDILILDEPTAGLDPKQRIAMRNLIGQLALHKIVIISTHIVSDIEFAAKELILLQQGRVIRQDTPSNLLQEINEQIWELIVPEEQLSSIRNFGQICSVARAENGILVRLLCKEQPELPSWKGRASLDDVYLSYFGEGDYL